MKHIVYALKLMGMVAIALILFIAPLVMAESVMTVSTPFAVVLMAVGILLVIAFASWTVEKGW
ncbi:hypothetical protein NXG04_07750 [Klebsiella pneumoniae]|nr:hypothetical protein [Klebsiella pneumoniae]MDS7714448.1 hypothetical protein [Klebsiella pneumoniae]